MGVCACWKRGMALLFWEWFTEAASPCALEGFGQLSSPDNHLLWKVLRLRHVSNERQKAGIVWASGSSFSPGEPEAEQGNKNATLPGVSQRGHAFADFHNCMSYLRSYWVLKVTWVDFRHTYSNIIVFSPCKKVKAQRGCWQNYLHTAGNGARRFGSGLAQYLKWVDLKLQHSKEETCGPQSKNDSSAGGRGVAECILFAD